MDFVIPYGSKGMKINDYDMIRLSAVTDISKYLPADTA